MDYIEIINAVLLLLAAIAAITPTEKDNNVVDRLRNIWKKIRGQ